MGDVTDPVTGTAATLPSDPGTTATARTLPSHPGATPDLRTAVQVPGYDVGERLGAGGFGEVFAARHTVIGRDVAIKVLHAKYCEHPAAVARFVAEARAVNRISHPGIVEIFDFGQLADGRHYCVMERLRGQTLRDLLRERGKLPLDQALPLLRAIAVAVDAAHAAGIAHRDLKPENVFVLADGIKLIDFGLAKLTAEESMTETGAVLGTPLYMSPEQCRGVAVDARTDAYSFGALAYHVLVGEPPFEGDALQLALHHLHDEPVLPSQREPALDARVDRVVLSLLAKDPGERPGKLVAAVDALVGEAPLPARTRRRRWRRWAVGGALATVAAGATGALFVAGNGGTPSRGSCALASARLAGVWDDAIRAKAAGPFEANSSDPQVRSSWSWTVRVFDGFATAWQAQWDAACASEDRTRDPLLYAQRIACLDNALVDFTGATSSLLAVEVTSFADSFSGNFSLPDLRDCATTAVLRAQHAPPPPEHRAEITQLLVDVQRARAQVRKSLNAGKHDELQSGLDRLEAIANRLEALASPTAATPLIWLSSYLAQLVDRERTAASMEAMRQRATAALDRTIRVAEAMRNERVLATAWTWRAQAAIAAGRPAAEVEPSLALARAALARAGTPTLLKLSIDEQQAMLDARDGRLERATEMLAAAVPLFEQWSPVVDGMNPRGKLTVLLQRLGRHREAVAVAERGLAIEIAAFGTDHRMVSNQRRMVAVARERAGDLDGALAIWEEDRGTTRTKRDAGHATWLAVQMLELALRRDQADLVARIDRELARVDPYDVARLAIRDGRLAVLAHVRPAVERSRRDRPFVDDAVATIAFYLGDDETMAAHAGRVELPATMTLTTDWLGWFPSAPWLAAIAEARAGRTAAAERQLAKLAHRADGADTNVRHGVLILNGLVRLAMRDYPGGREELEAARALPGWRPGWELADLDAWLGVARLESGDPAAAIASLETSLAGLVEHCGGFHYFAPMVELALARALWDTGGDRARARQLANQAKVNAARMPHRKHELVAAEQWLAAHPL